MEVIGRHAPKASNIALDLSATIAARSVIWPLRLLRMAAAQRNVGLAEKKREGPKSRYDALWCGSSGDFGDNGMMTAFSVPAARARRSSTMGSLPAGDCSLCVIWTKSKRASVLELR